MAVVFPSTENKIYWSGSYLTTKGAAKALGVSPQTVLGYVKDKRYPNPIKKKQGNRHYYLFTKSKVEEIEAKRREISG
ncbi:helix-turn-helix transcriptional regulator [Oricola sp.]|uniref:helix-turn-helix transcriptional regulator n=1 Tax=Oricola sp. TaxID=1979950 RepID=UPI003BA8B2C3